MTEHLFGLVARLHAQGHPPQKIYDALVTRIPTKLARRLVHKVTGCVVKRRTQVLTDEDRARRSATRKGKPGRTPNKLTRQRISAACKGKTRTQETRNRISAAVKQGWAERAAVTPTRVCARADCEAIVPKATMRYCSDECRKLVRRLQAAERARLRKTKIKRYTGHPGRSLAVPSIADPAPLTDPGAP